MHFSLSTERTSDVAHNYGLSSTERQVKFVQGSDDLGATSHLAGADETDPQYDVVELWRGDSLIQRGDVETPNVLKIDVEGHELDVIEGMVLASEDRRLRALVIEVHCGLLWRLREEPTLPLRSSAASSKPVSTRSRSMDFPQGFIFLAPDSEVICLQGASQPFPRLSQRGRPVLPGGS